MKKAIIVAAFAAFLGGCDMPSATYARVLNHNYIACKELRDLKTYMYAYTRHEVKAIQILERTKRCVWPKAGLAFRPLQHQPLYVQVQVTTETDLVEVWVPVDAAMESVQ